MSALCCDRLNQIILFQPGNGTIQGSRVEINIKIVPHILHDHISMLVMLRQAEQDEHGRVPAFTHFIQIHYFTPTMYMILLRIT